MTAGSFCCPISELFARGVAWQRTGTRSVMNPQKGSVLLTLGCISRSLGGDLGRRGFYSQDRYTLSEYLWAVALETHNPEDTSLRGHESRHLKISGMERGE